MYLIMIYRTGQKWGTQERWRTGGVMAELQTAEVQCIHGVHCLGCSYRSATSIYCHVTTGLTFKGFTLFIIHTVVNIVCGTVTLLARCSAVLQTENAALTVLK